MKDWDEKELEEPWRRNWNPNPWSEYRNYRRPGNVEGEI